MGIEALDASLLLFVQENLRGGALDGIMTCITYLGEFGALWILTALVLLLWKRTREGGFVTLLCLAFEFVINEQVLKRLIERTRPYEVVEGLTRIIAAQSSTSFPSGHSASSFAAATALTLAFGKKGAWAFIPAALIAFSRVYVGVHYPSDVLAGALVGTLVALAVYFAYRKLRSRGAGSHRRDK